MSHRKTILQGRQLELEKKNQDKKITSKILTSTAKQKCTDFSWIPHIKVQNIFKKCTWNDTVL